MAKKSVRCIKIVHLPGEVKKYRVLSAFFRFIGIFTCENLYDDKYGDDTDYVYLIPEGSEEVEKAEKVKEQEEGQWIRDALNEMKDVFGEKICEVLRRIEKIFSENDLMRASYGNAYFGDTGVRFIYQRMESALHKFQAALNKLDELEQEYLSDRLYIWVAKANCKRRINEIFTILWDAIESGKYVEGETEKKALRKALKASIHYYRLEEVKEDISKILKEDPDFYGAYAILGFVEEIDEYHDMEAGDAFKEAIRLIGDKSYASYLLLRLGRYQNNMYLSQEGNMKYYMDAYKADHHNFRAGYKLAVYEQDSGNDEKALELWNKLLWVLKRKEEQVSLQPVECAYLYKTYRNIGNLYNRRHEYSMAIQYLRKAVSVFDSKSNEDPKEGFYPWMFGREKVTGPDGTKVERWMVYKKAAKDKLKIEKTYSDIVYASGMTNREEIYDCYLALA